MYFPGGSAPITLSTRSGVLRFIGMDTVVKQPTSECHPLALDCSSHLFDVTKSFLELWSYFHNEMFAFVGRVLFSENYIYVNVL